MKESLFTLGCAGALGATSYFLLLGCAATMDSIRPERDPLPVTLAPAGARLDDAQGTFALDSANPVPLTWRSVCPDKPTTSNFREISNMGARVVRISYPGLSAPLYGLLALCVLPEDYSGPASRSYQLQIPQSYVDATEGGRVSVVFEPFDYQGEEHVAWSLWLSREASVFGAPPSPAGSEAPRALGGDVMKK